MKMYCVGNMYIPVIILNNRQDDKHDTCCFKGNIKYLYKINETHCNNIALQYNMYSVYIMCQFNNLLKLTKIEYNQIRKYRLGY